MDEKKNLVYRQGDLIFDVESGDGGPFSERSQKAGTAFSLTKNGDIVWRTGGVERARISDSGVFSGFPYTNLSSPLTTKGDIWGRSTGDARIPVGSDGQVLTAASAQALGVGWVNPPGFEVGYDQITASVNITGTSSAAATTVISGSAHTFDGAPVMLEFFAPQANPPNVSQSVMNVGLFESGTLLTNLFQVTNTVSGASFGSQNGICIRYRCTPSAGSHTYVIGAWVTSGTGTISANTGSGGTFAPAFLRFTKV